MVEDEEKIRLNTYRVEYVGSYVYERWLDGKSWAYRNLNRIPNRNEELGRLMRIGWFSMQLSSVKPSDRRRDLHVYFARAPKTQAVLQELLQAQGLPHMDYIVVRPSGNVKEPSDEDCCFVELKVHSRTDPRRRHPTFKTCQREYIETVASSVKVEIVEMTLNWQPVLKVRRGVGDLGSG